MYQGILEPVTNRQSWTQLIALIDPDTNEAFDITGFSIAFELRRPSGFPHSAGIFGIYYDNDPAFDQGPVLTATTANGAATIVGTGVIQIYFSETQMRALHPQTYSACCTITDPTGVNTAQVLRARLPVLSGGVTS